jgi:hypothetical protein
MSQPLAILIARFPFILPEKTLPTMDSVVNDPDLPEQSNAWLSTDLTYAP